MSINKSEEVSDNLIYEETQKMRQWYLWLILLTALFLSIFFLIGSFSDYIHGETGAASMIVIAALILFIMLFLIISIAGSKLKTKIDDTAIYFQWTPLSSKFNTVYWQNVNKAKLINYKNLGYGIRHNNKYGNIYNAIGGTGLYLETQSGNKFLIGSSNPVKLDDAVRKVMKNHDFEYSNEI